MSVAVILERVCCAVSASRASRTTSAFERAGLVVAEDTALERARADGSFVLLAIRSIALPAGKPPAVSEFTGGHQQVGAVASPVACPSPAARPAGSGAHAQSAWAPVFTSRLIRTPYELRVRDDDDASAQLELLAAAIGLERDRITIKPPPGWRGYGHPALWPPW